MGVTAANKYKELYGVGELPPLGHVPERMHAYTIRRDRHGPPEQSMRVEVVPTPTLRPHDVLIAPFSAGINYNGAWAAVGNPVSPLDSAFANDDGFHVAGSDAAGVVWAVGDRVKNWTVGDEVIVHCNQDDGNGRYDNRRIWGYETPDGSFAQFSRVQERQVLEKPSHLPFEACASYMLTLATAENMLFGWKGNILEKGQKVLVWGAAGGLGTFATLLAKDVGADVVGMISGQGDDFARKRDFVLSLGASGVLNRGDFSCWGALPKVNSPEFDERKRQMVAFAKAVKTAAGGMVDIVFEHPGEQTLPTSMFTVRPGGMVVICAGTSGYNITGDVRDLWMKEKRLQGSHFASPEQAKAANDKVITKRIDPTLVMGEVFSWDQIPRAHQMMLENQITGNAVATIIDASRGLNTFGQVQEALRHGRQ